MNTDTLEYYLTLIDEAERVVAGDPLGESYPICRYRLEEIKKEEEKPATPLEVRQSRRSLLLDNYQNCHSCAAWRGRNYSSPFEGSLAPRVLFVTDRILRQGVYMDKEEKAQFENWISFINLKGSECAYTSVIKCPSDSFEIPSACEALLKEQIEILNPSCVVFLGEAGALISSGEPDISYARTAVKTYAAKPCVVTYPPSAVISESALKKPLWADLKRLKAIIEGN